MKVVQSMMPTLEIPLFNISIIDNEVHIDGISIGQFEMPRADTVSHLTTLQRRELNFFKKEEMSDVIENILQSVIERYSFIKNYDIKKLVKEVIQKIEQHWKER